ncbi:MAG: ribonuclease P protein component [Candidatus Pelagibacter sp. TMED275]|nr:MAG: ribonuclease P protein component [Candidatus Pelagibacter sp. TMED275]|tara:strand:- start:3133 stop:3474 length:342 start_codon:yes stop_codon:yes gene_type:complete
MKSIIVSLSKNDEFKEILKGRKSNNKYCTIFFKSLLNKDKKKLNISFVAKKKLGNAVKRNKIKRKLRNIFNDATKKIKLKYEYSYLLIAKDTILKDKYLNVKETLFNELNKIR